MRPVKDRSERTLELYEKLAPFMWLPRGSKAGLMGEWHWLGHPKHQHRHPTLDEFERWIASHEKTDGDVESPGALDYLKRKAQHDRRLADDINDGFSRGPQL